MNFVNGFMLELMCIHHSSYLSGQTSHTVCGASIDHRNCFCLCQQNKSAETKVKFRQASNQCKRALEAAKVAYVNKTRVHHLPETFANFWRIANSVLHKGKYDIPPLFNSPEVLSSASDNTKLVKSFLRTLILKVTSATKQ